MTPLLETIIALVFIFLVFSLVTSWIVELAATRFQQRGKMLRQFLLDALDDRFNKNWGVLLYGHPLIEVLHHDLQLPAGLRGLFHGNKLNVKRKLPAYIPSGQFATAFIDQLIAETRPTRFVRDEQSGKYRLALEAEPGTAEPPGRSFSDFLLGLSTLKESELKVTLQAITRHIRADDPDALARLNIALAAWYDNGMERLNGWYKRKMRTWLFMVGLAVAVCCNLNTFTLVQRFYSDPQLRTAVNGAADSYLAHNDTLQAAPQTVEELRRRMDSLQATLAPLQLPIGWQLRDSGTERGFLTTLREIRNAIYENLSSPYTLLGWLLTAFALSFGAPFWFDALKKVSNVRNTGLRPGLSVSSNDPEKR